MLNSNITAGHVVERVPPIYPAEAKFRRIEGSVRIDATIGKDGLIHDPVVVHDPDGALSSAALTAVKQWRYAPFLLDGESVEVHTYVQINFVLGGSAVR